MPIIRKNSRVRDKKWNGKYTGTVVRTATRNGSQVLFVQWDNLAVEDELLLSEVEAVGEQCKCKLESVVKKLVH
ncbi:MAG: hypothetical protein A2218_10445 [Elusimicrobia bacterium RIFOXYA2_FULL_53_38]|nr:MAG: hypothetical protein A2218_10445 [Elusimicrobia bacterium RIFOXYA2_FULL_53_38]